MSRRRAGRGALIILAVLFAGSGILRFGSGLGAALAKSESEAATTGDPSASCEMPTALSEALTLREERVAAQEASLRDRLAALALADAAITKRMDEMKAVEAELKATLEQADGAAEKDIQNLTAVYQAMKPKDAAALFETMSPEFAAGFLHFLPARRTVRALAQPLHPIAVGAAARGRPYRG